MSSQAFNKIPREIWLKIFEYGVIEDAVKVHDLSPEFFLGCCFYIKHKLAVLRCNILQSIHELKHQLKTSFDAEILRLSMTTSVTFLLYVLTELNLLSSTVKRYFSNNNVVIMLCPYLIPVINQFEEVRKRAKVLATHSHTSLFHNARRLLNEHFSFLDKFDGELEDKISEITNITPFEIKAIDILCCCPSINSQLVMAKKNGLYDINFFCLFHQIKPIFQVPDVHNTQLSNKEKLLKLINYFRECVHWENNNYLDSILTSIKCMEYSLIWNAINEISRFEIISNLLNRYDKLFKSCYEPVSRSDLRVQKDNNLVFEKYERFITMNKNMTGLTVTITVPDQLSEHLPLCVHSFRKVKGLMGEEINVPDDNDIMVLKLTNNFLYKILVKRALQLCIIYREGFNSGPAEAIIDVGYDDSGEVHVSVNYLRAEPFTADNPIIQ